MIYVKQSVEPDYQSYIHKCVPGTSFNYFFQCSLECLTEIVKISFRKKRKSYITGKGCLATIHCFFQNMVTVSVLEHSPHDEYVNQNIANRWQSGSSSKSPNTDFPPQRTTFITVQGKRSNILKFYFLANENL